MSARRTEKGVVLEWRTGYEVDNLGFHVYRGPENARVRLTTSLLAGSGLQQSSGIETGASHSYRWSDETAGARAPDVEYWVEEIALSGERTWHGPVRPEMSMENGGADAGGTAPPSPGLVERTLNRAAPSAGVQIAAASAAPPQPDRRHSRKQPGQPFLARNARRCQCEVRRVLAPSQPWQRPTHFKPSGRLPRKPP